MAQVARNAEQSQEFWRPAVDESRSREAARAVTMQPESCDRCGTDFAMGARFCHICGHERSVEMRSATASRWNVLRMLDLERIKAAVGLPLASVVALFIGMVCAIAAAMTSVLYSATTLLDWQAVQIWRIEWLLAAITAFVAGILLKRNL
jgi:ribosomal protein L37E